MSTEVETLIERTNQGLLELATMIEQIDASAFPPLERQRPFQVGWGLLAALACQASAVVALNRSGMTIEAAPNRRLMIECVSHLKWLARDGEAAVNSMNLAHKHGVDKLVEAADASGLEYDRDNVDAMRQLDLPSGPTDQYNQQTPLLRSLDSPLYLHWTAETKLAHAGLTLSQRYIELGGSATTLFGKAKDGLDAAGAAMIPLLYLHKGARAFNELLEGHPWTDTLNRLADQHGLR